MKIPSLEIRYLGAGWFGTLVWNGIILFGLFSDWRSHRLSRYVFHQPKDLVLLMFPLIGLALLLWTIRQTILWGVYGETFFVSDAKLFPLGNSLSGRIEFPRPDRSFTNRRFRLKLLCQVKNGNFNTNVYTAWKDAHTVDIAANGTIPVAFSLPETINPNAFVVDTGSQMVWDLRVNEIGGGLRSFAAEYVLPAEDENRPSRYFDRKQKP